MDGRAVVEVDIEFYIGTMSWALPESLCGIHVLLAYQTY